MKPIIASLKKTSWLGLLACSLSPLFAQTNAPQRPRSVIIRRLANRGYLGVGVAELTDDRVSALKLKDDSGVEVKRVDENSPAAKVGLKEGDVILEVNGKPVEGIDQFTRLIGDTQPGTKVNLTIWRNGARQNLTATLESRTDTFPFGDFGSIRPVIPPIPPIPNFGNAFPALPGGNARLGFEGEALTSQLADFFGVKDGVLVRNVTPQSPAEKAGLKAGDVVVKVNGTPVTSPREIFGMVRASRGKSFSFGVVRNKKDMVLNIETAEDRPRASERLAL